MKISLSDNKVISLLLVALILQILLLLWHMELIGFDRGQASKPSGVVAGTIESIEKDLKRRPIDSLIWEESRAPEDIYFHDSVLTLSESTAKIQLKNGTQINLSENTLITIEPEKESASGEIRIRMTQGNLRARNPYEKAIIEDQSTSVKIEADSDIDLVKDSDGQIEILVNKGKADVVFQEKAYAVTKNERMVLNAKGVSKDKVSESLHWSDSETLRKYTHKLTSSLNLTWAGVATRLSILKDGNKIRQIPLTSQHSSFDLQLPLGTYLVYLNGTEGRTKNREVQVWEAPKIQLILPRPRDRRKTGTLNFVWTPQSDIESYELVLKTKKQTLRFPASRNKTSESIKAEDNYKWEVWGIDQKGFKIPPAYSYPLFLRENPFAPPKLNKPKIIKPRQKTSWWQQFLISPAWADDKQSAIFSWEKVPGAELYFIEIGKDKEFRSPLVKEQLSAPLYEWNNFDENETYYWRVAAGDRSGRMGMFSEPTVVDWDYVLPQNRKPKPQVAETRPRANKKKSDPTPLPQPVQKQDTETVVLAKQPKQKKNLPPRKYFKSAGMYYLPGYSLKNYKEDGQTKADLKGFNPFSLGIELEFFITRTSVIGWYSKYNQLEYEPQPKSDFPFQPNISTRTWINHVSWSPESSTWGGGLWISELPTFQRQSFEEVNIKQVWAYGLMARKSFAIGEGQWTANLALLSSNRQLGGASSQRFMYPLPWRGLTLGIELEAIYLTVDQDADLLLDSYLILGWKF